jgi:hypothetical protein
MTEEVENIFSAPEGSNEQVVVIPENYEETAVVPICIRCIDDEAKGVCRGWIEAAKPLAEQLQYLAKTVIRDVERVSELAEGSVHALSAKFGDRLDEIPPFGSA